MNRKIGMAPESTICGKKARFNDRGTQFEPRLLKHNVSRPLSRRRSAADCMLDWSDAKIGLVPYYDAAPTLDRATPDNDLDLNVLSLAFFSIWISQRELAWRLPFSQY